MTNRAATYAYIITTLEIADNLKNSNDLIESVIFSREFAPEISKCLRSLALIVFGEEPSVSETIQIQYALVGLVNGKCKAKTSKGTIICSIYGDGPKISIRTNHPKSLQNYKSVVSEYDSDRSVS
jgi:hypothetical protein